jgi:hypothetical protein
MNFRHLEGEAICIAPGHQRSSYQNKAARDQTATLLKTMAMPSRKWSGAIPWAGGLADPVQEHGYHAFGAGSDHED